MAGDKSISHRALMLAALAPGTSTVQAPNRGADVMATRDAIAALGAKVRDGGETIEIDGGTLHDPAATLDARNSGTTARLLMGLCAGHGITAVFDGDASLRRRPMERVARPLRALGADVRTTAGRLPARVRGISEPPGGEFQLELASAQVKSAILLANLGARGPVIITGDRSSRDHTERMLRRFGRQITFDGRTIALLPGALTPQTVRVPADLSGAGGIDPQRTRLYRPQPGLPTLGLHGGEPPGWVHLSLSRFAVRSSGAAGARPGRAKPGRFARGDRPGWQAAFVYEVNQLWKSMNFSNCLPPGTTTCVPGKCLGCGWAWPGWLPSAWKRPCRIKRP